MTNLTKIGNQILKDYTHTVKAYFLGVSFPRFLFSDSYIIIPFPYRAEGKCLGIVWFRLYYSSYCCRKK